MAIPSDLPFSVQFLLGGQSDVMDCTLDVGADGSLRDPCVTVRENTRLRVLFEAQDNQARFYMDGLEMLPARMLETDVDGRVCLSPNARPYTLYDHTGAYSALIPGVYSVFVRVAGLVYSGAVEVSPSRVSRTQWQIMRDQLEGQVRGLAQQAVRERAGGSQALGHHIPPEQLHRFLTIRRHFSSVVAALADLSLRPHQRIRKTYQMRPADRVKAVDEVTIRHRLMHPEQTDSLKVPLREVDVDLPENRWVRAIASSVDAALEDVGSAVEVYQTHIGLALAEAERYSPSGEGEESGALRENRAVMDQLAVIGEDARKMRTSLQAVTQAPWYRRLSRGSADGLSHVVLQDARYRALYQLYRELRAGVPDIVVDAAYATQWKRSDVLYELWGFLRVCQSLTEDLGYTPVSGWVYEDQDQAEKMLVPILPPGTLIALQSDEVRLHLVYDMAIPIRASQTDPEQTPLHMIGGFHNRPDARLDVFSRGVYCGSVMIDFKYRPRSAIWNPEGSWNRRTLATNQLISYASDSKSAWLLGSLIPGATREQLRPVFEVWAMYPQHEDYAELPGVEYDERYQVRVVPLSPGMDCSHVARELRTVIDRILAFGARFRAVRHEA